MIALRRLLRDTRGSTVTEFAFVFPVFIVFLLGGVEGCRLMWSQQVLETAAYEAVRCMSVSSSCDTTAEQQAKAISAARDVGLTITSSAVTITANTTCRGHASSNQVRLRTAFSSVLKGFVPMPTTIEATACFPVVTLT